jgi:hypothetical protein
MREPAPEYRYDDSAADGNENGDQKPGYEAILHSSLPMLVGCVRRRLKRTGSVAKTHAIVGRRVLLAGPLNDHVQGVLRPNE